MEMKKKNSYVNSGLMKYVNNSFLKPRFFVAALSTTHPDYKKRLGYG